MAAMMKDEIVLDDEKLKKASGGSGENSGMPCPCCGNLIPVTIREIMTKDVILCPSCGLRFDVHNKKSK